MIPIGTHLQPRNPSDPVVRIGGAEPEQGRYCLSDIDFGPVFAMDSDEIAAAYDCTGYKVFIEPYDEAAEWRKLSREKFTKGMQAGARKANREAARPSPEQVFADADKAAAAEAGVEAESSFTKKLRKRA